MSQSSQIACVMSTYNDEKTILEAASSILNATVPVDLYVVDDGSRIPAKKALESLKKTAAGKRLFVIRMPQNVGITKCVNVGVKKCLEKGNYKFIARMDADDISYPERFERQMKFFAENPEIIGVGTWARQIDGITGRELSLFQHPTDIKGIRKTIPLYCCYTQPSSMFRTECFTKYGLYDEQFPVAQDYEFFYRLSKVEKLANIPEVLLDYRMYKKSTSIERFKKQSAARLRIQLRYFNPLQVNCWRGVLKSIMLITLPKKIVDFIRWKRG